MRAYVRNLKLIRHLWTWGSFAREAEPRELKLLKLRCCLCGCSRLIRLYQGDSGIRCPRCFGGTTAMSLALVLEQELPAAPINRVYELSSSGPFFRYLKRKFPSVTGSEYWPDVAPGEWKGGYQCQNVEDLTYADASFDLVTSSEVFEHVVDDRQGFREVHRVLTSNGVLVFSVPIALQKQTLERAMLKDGVLHHLEKPEYHDDELRGRKKVLAFRSYGADIVDRLLEAGFRHASINKNAMGRFHGEGRAIIVARA